MDFQEDLKLLHSHILTHFIPGLWFISNHIYRLPGDTYFGWIQFAELFPMPKWTFSYLRGDLHDSAFKCNLFVPAVCFHTGTLSSCLVWYQLGGLTQLTHSSQMLGLPAAYCVLPCKQWQSVSTVLNDSLSSIKVGHFGRSSLRGWWE